MSSAYSKYYGVLSGYRHVWGGQHDPGILGVSAKDFAFIVLIHFHIIITCPSCYIMVSISHLFIYLHCHFVITVVCERVFVCVCVCVIVAIILAY